MIKKINIIILKKFPKGSFSRNVATIMTGTTIAQAIAFFVSPILTRIYSPTDFGIFALFNSSIAIVTVFMGLKYENAIILPEKDSDAINLVALSVLIAMIVSSLVFIAVLFFGEKLFFLMGGQTNKSMLFYYPTAILFIGVYIPFYNWLNRLGRYKTMAYRGVIQVVITNSLNLYFGIAGYYHTGLIISFIIGQAAVLLILSYDVYTTTKGKLHFINLNSIRFLSKRYSKFPIFDLPSSVVSLFSSQAPVFFFSKYFGSSIVGFYSHSNKVLGVPSNLFSASILCVFKQRAAKDFNELGNCRKIFVKTFRHLFCLSIIPFIILIVFSPFLFEFIFSEQWRVAGEFASILSIMFFIRFITSPLTYMFYIAEKQNYDLLGQLLFLISTLISVFLGVHYQSVKTSIIVMTIGHSTLYLLYLYFSFRFAAGKIKQKKTTVGV